MNRKAFGQLIASLRQELGWTQFQLAEYADLDENTLSNIERGVKKHLEPELLLALANALNLTSLERREFFLASCGLDPDEIFRQPDGLNATKPFDAQAFINQQIEALSQIYAPCYIANPYGDLIAINRICAELVQIDLSEAQVMAAHKKGKLNSLHLIYGMISIQESFGDQLNEFILGLLQNIRAVSLRYRTTPYFTALMTEFLSPKKYPLFERYWRKSTTFGIDKIKTSDSFTLEHKKYGRMCFITSPTSVLTPHGELFVNSYTATDQKTARDFIEIANLVGTEMVQIATWP